MERSAPSLLLALSGMFGEAQPHGGPTLADDVGFACEDPAYEPAHASVRVMLALFPALAPSPSLAPAP